MHSCAVHTRTPCERPMHQSGWNWVWCIVWHWTSQSAYVYLDVRQHCTNFGNISFSDGWFHCSWTTHTRPDLCVLWLDTTHSIPIWIQTWACGIEASKHGNKIVNLLNMKFAWGFDRICMPLTSQCLPYVCKIARNTQIQTLCCKQHMTK